MQVTQTMSNTPLPRLTHCLGAGSGRQRGAGWRQGAAQLLPSLGHRCHQPLSSGEQLPQAWCGARAAAGRQLIDQPLGGRLQLGQLQGVR